MYGLIICLITLSALLFGLYAWCGIPPKSAEHKTIIESNLFKISLLAPIAFSLLSAAFIFLVIDGKFNFGISSIDSFKNFYELFKIPLSLIAASPVTAGIAAMAHRSEETKLQLLQAERKNDFDRYIKHREIIKDEIYSLLERYNSNYKNKFFFDIKLNIFYNTIFPNNTSDKFNDLFISQKALQHAFKDYLNQYSFFLSDKSKMNPEPALKSLGFYLVVAGREQAHITRGFHDTAITLLTEVYNLIESNYSKKT